MKKITGAFIEDFGQMVSTLNELIDAFNKHQEEHDKENEVPVMKVEDNGGSFFVADDSIEEIPKEQTWIKIGDLEWLENCTNEEMTWEEAKAYCEEQGGRLPECWEMVKAVDENYDEIQKLTEDSPASYFWSATESSGSVAWRVVLTSGSTSVNFKTIATHLRAVRDIK